MGITVPRIISSAASRLPESAPENAITRAYIGPPFRSEGPILRLCCGGALGRALAAALLAPEHQGAGDPRKREPEQRLVRPSALDGRSRALCLAFHDALADLPDAPAEDGVAAVDDAHARCSSRCAIRPHGRSPYGLLVGVASERLSESCRGRCPARRSRRSAPCPCRWAGVAAVWASFLASAACGSSLGAAFG